MPEPVRTSSAPNAGSMSIGDIYYLLFRYKWTILIFTLLGVLASVVVYLVTPGVYQSEATLIVRYVSDTSILQELSSGERITVPGRGGENVINSEIAILTSRDLVEKVVDDMGVGQFSADPSNEVTRAKIAENVMAALGVETPKNSNIIKVTFYGSTPAIAQGFLDRLTTTYLQKHMDIHRENGAYDFLSRQTDELKTRLDATEKDLSLLKQKEGIVSIEDAKKNAAQRLVDLSKGLDDLEINLAAAKARMEVLRPALSILVPSSAPLSTTSTVPVASETSVRDQDRVTLLKYRLFALQRREADLLAAYTPDSIPVRSVREQIAALIGVLGSELVSEAPKTATTGSSGSSGAVSTGGTTIHSSSFPLINMPDLLEEEATIAAMNARIGLQKVMLERAKEDAKKIDGVESSIVRLQRNKELQEANYRYFCQSLEHARVDEALNSGRFSNINIVQPATRPSKMTRVNLPKKMGIALFVGIGLGVGLAVLKEFFLDNTIRHAGELSSIFGAALVMTLPLMGKNRPCARRGKGAAAGGESSELREFCDSFWVHLLPTVDLVNSSKPYILGITSCATGAGVSALSDGLALALAKDVGEGVVLVDACMESDAPTCYEVEPDGTFAETIPVEEGTAGGSRKTQARAADAAHSKPVYSTRTQGFTATVEKIRAAGVRFVIVDLPPVTETGLTLRVARLLNGVVMVVPSERITRSVAGHVRRWLVLSNVKVVSSILNMRRKYVPAWLCQKL